MKSFETQRNIFGGIEILLDKYLKSNKQFDTIKKVLVAPSKQIIEYKKHVEQLNVLSTSPTDSIKIRNLVDRIITFTSTILPGKKYLDLLIELGKLCSSQGEHKFATDIFSNVLYKTASDEKFTDQKATALLGLAEVAAYQANWKDSFSFAKKAKTAFESVKNNKGLAVTENLIGTNYAEKGDLIAAKKHYTAGLELQKKTKDKQTHAMILLNLGILCNIEGDLESTKQYYEKSLLMFKSLGDTKNLAKTLHNLGMLYTKEGNFEKAISYFDKCIKVSQEARYFPSLGISFLSKAYILCEQNELDSASEFVNKGLEISLIINDRLSIADIYKIKGIIERKKKNYDIAENYLLSSLRMNLEFDNRLNYAET
ncbi:MAG: tetratricopeptide repeat protein, partial [Bacteroidetes bacterium]|nr:tetratricopeptide repeat protein [Bacteroidota bacterium]